MSRQYEEVYMPLAEGTTLLHPERALLRWEGLSGRSDVGQICYLTRDTSSSTRARHTFDPTSFSSERARVVRLLVTQLSGLMALGAVRTATIATALRIVLEFVNWADRQGLHQVLCDESATADAVHRYFRERREQVSLGNLNCNSVGTQASRWWRSTRTSVQKSSFRKKSRSTDNRKRCLVPTELQFRLPSETCSRLSRK